jgi:hypothetical protein
MKWPLKFPALLSCSFILGCSPAQVKPPAVAGSDAAPPAAGASGAAGVLGTGGAGGGGRGGAVPTAGTGGVAMPAPPPARPDAARPVDRPPPPDRPPLPKIVFVTGSEENAEFANDETLIDRLEDAGFDVDPETDTSVEADDLEGAVALVLSASTDSASVRMALADAPTLALPIVAMDENLEPFLNMVGAGAEDRGTTDQTQVTIAEGADPALTAGLSGTVTVYSVTFGIAWGIPGPGAIKVATVNGNANEVAIYAYPKDAMMANNATAPAKRVFFFVRESAEEDLLTDDGLKLFEAAVKYAAAP